MASKSKATFELESRAISPPKAERPDTQSKPSRENNTILRRKALNSTTNGDIESHRTRQTSAPVQRDNTNYITRIFENIERFKVPQNGTQVMKPLNPTVPKKSFAKINPTEAKIEVFDELPKPIPIHNRTAKSSFRERKKDDSSNLNKTAIESNRSQAPPQTTVNSTRDERYNFLPSFRMGKRLSVPDTYVDDTLSKETFEVLESDKLGI